MCLRALASTGGAGRLHASRATPAKAGGYPGPRVTDAVVCASSLLGPGRASHVQDDEFECVLVERGYGAPASSPACLLQAQALAGETPAVHSDGALHRLLILDRKSQAERGPAGPLVVHAGKRAGLKARAPKKPSRIMSGQFFRLERVASGDASAAGGRALLLPHACACGWQRAGGTPAGREAILLSHRLPSLWR